MVNYKKNKKGAILEIRQWMIDNAIQYDKVEFQTYSTEEERERAARKKIKEMEKKARLNVQWRQSLSDRLLISMDDITRATNTIIEIIEKSLAKGYTVRLANFGDIKTINTKFGTQVVRFKADEKWIRELNEPFYTSELGLKRKLVKGKLTRRNLVSDNIL